MRIYLLAILIMIICLFTSCKSADDYLNESNTLADQGKYKGAIEAIDKAIEKKPKFREAYINRGLCHEKLKDFNSAIADYYALMKIDKNNTLGLYYIGNCKFDLHLFEEAIHYYNEALITKGYSIENDTSRTSGFVLELNKDLFKAAKFDVESNKLFYQRGLAYYQLNKLQSAYADFAHCLTNNYYPADCHYMIALCYFESGNKEKACLELDKGIILGDTLSLKKKEEICD